jgi:transposase
MHKNREIIRLAFDTKLSGNQIAASLSISRGYVHKCIQRAVQANLTWPLLNEVDDDALEAMLFKTVSSEAATAVQEFDWEYIHTELKRKGVNLSLLWHEYTEKTPKPLSYSQFCKRYRKWLGKTNLVMRQEHRAGEKLFVDYAGHTMQVKDSETGEACFAQIFLSTLGASNYSFAEATWTQESNNWIGSHVRAFEFYGGVPEILVPDNLKVGITKFHPSNTSVFGNFAPLLERSFKARWLGSLERSCHSGCDRRSALNH